MYIPGRRSVPPSQYRIRVRIVPGTCSGPRLTRRDFAASRVGANNYDDTGGNFRFDNHVKVVLAGLPSKYWIPPLSRYFDKFKYERLQESMTQLDTNFRRLDCAIRTN